MLLRTACARLHSIALAWGRPGASTAHRLRPRLQAGIALAATNSPPLGSLLRPLQLPLQLRDLSLGSREQHVEVENSRAVFVEKRGFVEGMGPASPARFRRSITQQSADRGAVVCQRDGVGFRRREPAVNEDIHFAIAGPQLDKLEATMHVNETREGLLCEIGKVPLGLKAALQACGLRWECRRTANHRSLASKRTDPSPQTDR